MSVKAILSFIPGVLIVVHMFTVAFKPCRRRIDTILLPLSCTVVYDIPPMQRSYNKLEGRNLSATPSVPR